MSVIQSIGMLPSAAARHFELMKFKIGDAHHRDGSERRAERWHGLVADLHAMVDAAETDPRLSREAGFGPIDASDRPTTAGERITALCRQLQALSPEDREFAVILSKIDMDAHSGIKGDVAELRRLVGMKRIPDYARHRQSIAYRVAHMVEIAGQMHHLR